ncbi:MAG: DUF1549 domain-containing protein [Verrucomicrobiaceae bacterium]|nr:DUF1549 domain-containing protein [Verrucomicrobiaceae bacterium]
MRFVARSFALIATAFAAPVMAGIDFSHQVVPILKKHCAECHTGAKKKGGLSFNTRADLLEGSENGAVITPGKGAESAFIKLVTSTDPDEQMPPKGPRLTAEEVKVLSAWIDEKLPWEPGFAFNQAGYEPPLRPRDVALPEAVDGRNHPIDRIIDSYLDEKKVPRPAPISDGVFLRRVTLDITGLLPSAEEYRAFVADPRPDKRALRVRELLDNGQAYAEHWMTFWNDLLRNDYAGTGYIDGGRKQISAWLYRSLADNVPYDRFVRELVAPGPEAEGFINGIKWRGNVNASQVREIQFAQNIGQVFLGINLKCASCHDSFIDRWKLDECYNLAAVFADEELQVHRCDKPQGRVAKAAWIFPELGQIEPEAPRPERLKQMANLLTSPENGRFTRTIANRLWDRFMGHGIAHPVDAMGTRPWSEPLLDYLANFTREQKYDLKKVIEHIVTSQAYQSVSAIAEEDMASDRYTFSGPIARRMTAEQFMDAVWQMTGTAPTKMDAVVQRGGTSTTANAAPAEKLTARWIWSDADFGKAPAGKEVVFRTSFKLAGGSQRAAVVLTADNEYRLWVNNKEVAADGDLAKPETIPLGPLLRAGINHLMIVVKNGGQAPNPAGLLAELRVQDAKGNNTAIGTDASWEWTESLPDSRAKFPDGTMWRPAVEITAPVYQRFGEQVRVALASCLNETTAPIRAALVKSNLLMRTLGRPNREQVVTTRPAIFTTLEAIDLANGKLLTDLLNQGAAKINAAQPDASQRVTDLFQNALSRDPSAEERAALEMLATGAEPNTATADLLWAILMLPEFQLVR